MKPPPKILKISKHSPWLRRSLKSGSSLTFLTLPVFFRVLKHIKLFPFSGAFAFPHFSVRNNLPLALKTLCHPSELTLHVDTSEKASSLKWPQLGLHVILSQNILLVSLLAPTKTCNSFYLPTYVYLPGWQVNSKQS